MRHLTGMVRGIAQQQRLRAVRFQVHAHVAGRMTGGRDQADLIGQHLVAFDEINEPEAPAQRMCPVFRVTHTEEATPRAKANLLRHLLQDGIDPRTLASEEVRAVADLCVNCRMCAHECPAHCIQRMDHAYQAWRARWQPWACQIPRGV